MYLIRFLKFFLIGTENNGNASIISIPLEIVFKNLILKYFTCIESKKKSAVKRCREDECQLTID